MAVLDPSHLLEQAERLIRSTQAGTPRQADIRRSISSAYYATFHAVLAATADEFVGKTKRGTAEYHLVYRSISHRWLRELSVEAAKLQPGKRIARHSPAGGFGRYLRAMATIIPGLQEARHKADYDPSVRMRTADARTAIDNSRDAIARLDGANKAARKRFLTLLAFPPTSS